MLLIGCLPLCLQLMLATVLLLLPLAAAAGYAVCGLLGGHVLGGSLVSL